ncbi:centrosomal protein of 70 kDa-like isoform X2 [Octopus sinensis]|uniref:Centrosomal protein of 70 kDa n=1 Tax=Octopus sinensis TaxID=2607531 RepID=A0A6P7TAI3_9MOLL|nr:centrosomal protein of 70 kDa-like isoform X1 [Octopus sinensis]XP_036366429.1 centrosomal protein of 70 kDa-like isoform X2 [Octopus sinensis]
MEPNGDCSGHNRRHPDASGDGMGIGISPRYYQIPKEGDFMNMKLKDCMSKDQKLHPQRSDILSEFQRHTANIQSLMNEKIFDIVEAYERRIKLLEKDLEYYQKKHQSIEEEEGFLSHKSVLHRNQEKTLKDYVKKVNLLEAKLKMLELEKQSRVSTKDSRMSPNASCHKFVDNESCKETQQSHNDRLNLQELYQALDVENSNQLLPAIQKMKHNLKSMAKYRQYCFKLCSLVQQTQNGKTEEQYDMTSRPVLSDDTLKYILEMLALANDDFQNRQDLVTCFNEILTSIVPWTNIQLHPSDSFQEMVTKLQMVNQSSNHIITKDEQDSSSAALENLVQHFQILFEVPTLSGIYPAMNQVYTKVGELQNIMKILKTLLGLDPSSKPSTVVDAVNEICQMHNATTSTQLKHLLQTEDLESIIKRLEEYDSFFPAFHAVMSELLELLNVQSLSDVVPAVKTLSLLAQ